MPVEEKLGSCQLSYYIAIFYSHSPSEHLWSIKLTKWHYVSMKWQTVASS